jgi:hypothetical protein
MDDVSIRILENLLDRIGGPMSFRFILQPVTASMLAIVSGWQDAKLGKSPYFWALVTERANRANLVKDGWKRIGKVFIAALALDLIYQIIFLHIYLGEALIVAVLLAIIPYVIVRGVATRLFILFLHRA